MKLVAFYCFGAIKYARILGVKIGNNCRVYIRDWGSEPFLIEIGNNVTVTSGVRLLTHDGATWLTRDKKGRRFLFSKIKIKDNVFIGVNAVLMPGVVVESNVIIAAGSIVTKSVPSGVIVAGNPAVVIGKFIDYKSKALNDYFSEDDFREKDRSMEYYCSSSKRYMNI